MEIIDLANKYAWSLLHTPYRWGGDDPSGFDCSGLVVEILKSIGLLPSGIDLTAQGLYNRYRHLSIRTPIKGALAFYGNPIHHVVWVVNQTHSIEATGGSKIKTYADAIKYNAFVKLRPLRHFTRLVDPFIDLRVDLEEIRR